MSDALEGHDWRANISGISTTNLWFADGIDASWYLQT